MKLSALLDRHVVTESGENLGRAFDVRGELRADRLEITGFVVARHGLFERLGIVGLRALRSHRRVHGAVVPWDAVVALRGDRIVVRDDR